MKLFSILMFALVVAALSGVTAYAQDGSVCNNFQGYQSGVVFETVSNGTTACVESTDPYYDAAGGYFTCCDYITYDYVDGDDVEEFGDDYVYLCNLYSALTEDGYEIDSQVCDVY